MQRRAIYKKEWLKFKWYLPALATAAVAAALHFWFELDLAFASIEPESMLWYRFAPARGQTVFLSRAVLPV